MNTLKNIIKIIFPPVNIALSAFFLNERTKNFKVNTAEFSKVRYTFEILLIAFLVLNIANFIWILYETFFVAEEDKFL